MKVLTLEQVAQKLADANIYQISKDTGIAYNTLKNIKEGKGAQYFTVVKLTNYFRDQE